MIVSNASPLIVLLKINKLSILKELFGKIIIPVAVYNEITAKEPDNLIFDKIGWIKTRSVTNIEMTAPLEKLIDRGKLRQLSLPRS